MTQIDVEEIMVARKHWEFVSHETTKNIFSFVHTGTDIVCEISPVTRYFRFKYVTKNYFNFVSAEAKPFNNSRFFGDIFNKFFEEAKKLF